MSAAIKRRESLKQLMQERIAILDGAMGTMIQKHKLEEDAFRAERLKDYDMLIKGNNDLLSITQPQIIKDIYKTLVYDLARFCNRRSDRPVIPPSIIERPPTAELREDQLDTDSLPPYPVLDPILKAYVEEDQSLAEIVAAGFDEELVRRVIRSVDLNEYKRRQAPPGVKITLRAFGRDRRLPITNRCREY